jgi:vacuolar-type H+-ATPase catalytic subunit A/Vma1
MKAVTVKELKTALNNCSQSELIDLCLHLSKFKKENKELLTYLLFESDFEEGYIETVKLEIDEQFKQVNTKTYYFIKKSVRKILRMIKKYIRYSKKKETEIELLLYFCKKLKAFKPSINNNTVLKNIYLREIESIRKKLPQLHEDLQYDYNLELTELLAIKK